MKGQHSASNGALDMNSNTTTRRVWTDTITSTTAPANAAPEWKSYHAKLQTLLKALFNHPAMEANRQQTFSTPAKAKNGVYFMWDFVQRTMWFLDATPVTLTNMDPDDKETWSDVHSRSLMACQLILDTQPGMLRMMVEGTYPGQPNPCPDMGEEVLRAARDLQNA